MIKSIILFLGFLLCVNINAQKLTKIWESEPIFDTPESVLVDQKHKCMYVSNIGGNQPWAKDGNGFISKLALDGTMIKKNWVVGLHSPKGMAISNHSLFVADVDRIIEIDMHKGMIKNIIAVKGSSNLNDIAPLNKDEIIFSDSGGKAIYTMKGGNYTKIIDSTYLKRPNGVLIHGKNTFVLDNDAVNIWSGGQLQKIVDGMPGGIDGIEPINQNEFIVSCWSGTVYHVDIKNKTKKLLLDSTANKINTADIGMDRRKNIVYVPTFFNNKVVAYQYSK
jgi:DNA-binding beta-propeller fold protein YncE